MEDVQVTAQPESAAPAADEDHVVQSIFGGEEKRVGKGLRFLDDTTRGVSRDNLESLDQKSELKRPPTGVDEDAPPVPAGRVEDKEKMGTFLGVFVPCMQNILGTILYLRLSWIVGQAGVGMVSHALHASSAHLLCTVLPRVRDAPPAACSQALLVVGVCCMTTFTTALSLSAIATNGAIKGGGTSLTRHRPQATWCFPSLQNVATPCWMTCNSALSPASHPFPPLFSTKANIPFIYCVDPTHTHLCCVL